MKKLLLVFVTFLISNLCVAQPTMAEWVSTFGGNGTEFPFDLHLDEEDNSYLTGYFTGSVNFGSGAGAVMLSSKGEIDAFVAKYDADGELQWAVQLGGTGEDQGNGVTTDADGNVYVTGYFEMTVDFDPGEGVANMNSAGNKDIFIVKLSATGEWIWSKRIGDTSTDEAQDIALDENGGVYLTGRFTRDVDFDPGSGTAVLDGWGSVPDMFILKLDQDGAYEWAKKIGVGEPDRGETLAIAPDGTVVIAGIFSGNVDFDPGAGTTQIFGAGLADVFVTKFTAAGDFVWASTFRGEGFETCQDIAIDNDGNIYAGGWFRETVDFNNGGAPLVLTSEGAEDSFLAKFNPAGDVLWVKQIGGENLEWTYNIAVDVLGDVYATGFFYDTVDFDPGPGVSNLTSASIEDIFLYKLSTDGDFRWAKRMGGPMSQSGYGLEIGASGDIFTTGTFRNTSDLDPEETVWNFTAVDGADGYLLKVDQTVISSVREAEQLELQLFPNPSVGNLTIAFEKPLHDAILRIRSVSGAIILDNIQLLGHQIELDISSQPAGLYLVEIQSGTIFQQMKWLKM